MYQAKLPLLLERVGVRRIRIRKRKRRGSGRASMYNLLSMSIRLLAQTIK
jgi:hypothetical protein